MELSELVERHRSWVVTAAAVVPLVVCAVLAGFRDSLPGVTSVLALVLVVVGAASTGVRAAGIVAALSSGLWFDFFLTRPYHELSIDKRDDVVATVLLVLIGAAVTEVALWGHRQQARASRRAGYLDGILRTAEIVTAQHDSPQRLVDHVAAQIREVLGVARCSFVAGPVHDPGMPVMDHRGLVTRRGHPVDVDRDGLPTDDTTALAVARGNLVLGHFLVTAAADIARPTLEQRKVAVLLADQVGSVLTQRAG